ncbi:hypothetical protein QYE76_048981 [Lolium multiflorum]|uniref:DUF4283 domain-containing protein n=1 Tax=Lolium multiflorum TaxID=4521 RepID=A0AAD8SM35_LOLMU|nr:hypothetical protein QYE76_048981 [Lolium multiflorum]
MEGSKEAAPAEGSASKEIANHEDVEAMMASLGISEEDLEDVVFEEEVEQNQIDNRWMAVGRVHTDTEFSHFWFFKNMRSAWDLAKDVKIRVIDDNRFIFKFSCLGDWEKVMEGGPWVFRGKSVLLAPYDGFTKPSSIELNKVMMWIQIHDLQDGYKSMVKTLASKVGDFVAQEQPSTDMVGNFYRVRVKIDVRKELKSVVSIIRAQKRELFLVKYERIPDWCSVCGMLGHLYKEHGDGVHDLAAQVFRGLRAESAVRFGGRPSVRGGGRFSGRGGRGGRGEEIISDADMMSEDDITDPNRKRPALPPNTKADVVDGKGMNVGVILQQFEQTKQLPGLPPSPPVKRDPKRSKKAMGEDAREGGNGQNSSESAGLHGGYRQDQ